jgi:hypothetical protein
MKITRCRFRLAEAILGGLGFVIIDGLMHLSAGEPFWSQFLAGGVAAVVILRGYDALKAYNHVWPEV